jgi:hypothetical protein
VRKELAGVEVDEAIMVRADVPDMDLVEARVDVGLDRREVLLGGGSARDSVTDLLLGHELCGLLEVAWRGENLGELAGERLVGPHPIDRA